MENKISAWAHISQVSLEVKQVEYLQRGGGVSQRKRWSEPKSETRL